MVNQSEPNMLISVKMSVFVARIMNLTEYFSVRLAMTQEAELLFWDKAVAVAVAVHHMATEIPHTSFLESGVTGLYN